MISHASLTRRKEPHPNDFACGVIGVGHEEERLGHVKRVEQHDHFVQQRSLVAIGEDQTFVDATGQRNGEDAGCGLDQDGDCLTGMAEDVLRLGVGLGLLMKLFVALIIMVQRYLA